MAVETPAIELRHVTRSFGTRRVLDDVCLSISPGRSVCVLGRGGTGQSVALKHIVGLIARGGPEALDRSEVPLVRQFMTSEGAG